MTCIRIRVSRIFKTLDYSFLFTSKAAPRNDADSDGSSLRLGPPQCSLQTAGLFMVTLTFLIAGECIHTSNSCTAPALEPGWHSITPGSVSPQGPALNLGLPIFSPPGAGYENVIRWFKSPIRRGGQAWTLTMQSPDCQGLTGLDTTTMGTAHRFYQTH
jgi:hypothetical protein